VLLPKISLDAMLLLDDVAVRAEVVFGIGGLLPLEFDELEVSG
jgi:hypothetical protein